MSRNFVHPNSKSPVTVIFIFHACTLRACSDLQVESYGVAGPLVETLYYLYKKLSPQFFKSNGDNPCVFLDQDYRDNPCVFVKRSENSTLLVTHTLN